MRWVVWSLVLFLGACAGVDEAVQTDGAVQTEGASETERCVERNPANDPFDVGDVSVAAPPPGSTLPEPEPPSAASIAEVCRMSRGTGCDPDEFISKDAASCIALSNDFELGLEPWKVALTYHHGFARVVWNVMSKLQDRGRDGYAGGILTLDATQGVVLNRGGYDATP